MGGEEEAIKIVLYVVVMLIVVGVGLGLVLGFNPTSWAKKLHSTNYEPGKIIQTQDLQKNTLLDCSQSTYLLTLKDLKFEVKPGLSVEGGSLEFVVALDFRNMIFLSSDETQNLKTVKCSQDNGEFRCDDTTLRFYIACTGGLNDNEVFHFTTWEAKPAVLDAMKPTGTCGFPSISKVLDNYGQFYLSSFNSNINVKNKCEQTECEAQDSQNSCASTPGCYWGGWPGFKSCQFCSTSTACSDYSGDACAQCPIPKANCKPGVLYGCGPA